MTVGKSPYNALLIKYLIFLILFFLNIPSGKTQSSEKKHYGIGFSKKDWNIDPSLLQAKVKSDSTRNADQPALLFTQDSTFAPIFPPLRVNMFKRFYLPGTGKKYAKIFFHTKCSGLKYVWVKVYAYNKDEQVVRTDSININNAGSSNHLIIPLENILFLGVEIKSEGEKFAKKSALWLNRMFLEIDGKEYASSDTSMITSPSKLKDEEVIPLTTSWDDLLSVLKDKQLISLGETIHGNERFTLEAFEIICHMIQKADCRIIFIELPPERILKWDLFIKNQTSLSPEELLDDLQGSIISPKISTNLLLWLKEYNKKNEEKISITGMDIRKSYTHNTIFLHDYLYYLNEQKHDPLIDSLAILIYENKAKEAFQYLIRYPQISQITGDINFTALKHSLQRQHSNGGIPGTVLATGPYKIRDYFMADFVENIVDSCLQKNKKAIIYAHWSHINNIDQSIFPTLSAGAYLKQKYGDRYYSIGLLAGQGTITGEDPITLQMRPDLSLGNPPEHSIEKRCMKTDSDHFFFEGKTLKDPILLIRDIGNSAPVYGWHTLNRRTDGYIFIRDNYGFKFPQGWFNRFYPIGKIKRDTSLMEKIKRYSLHHQKIKERLSKGI